MRLTKYFTIINSKLKYLSCYPYIVQLRYGLWRLELSAIVYLQRIHYENAILAKTLSLNQAYPINAFKILAHFVNLILSLGMLHVALLSAIYCTYGMSWYGMSQKNMLTTKNQTKLVTILNATPTTTRTIANAT